VSQPEHGFDALREEVLAGKLDRRQVLKRGAMLGLSAPVIAGLLAACGGSEKATSTPAAAATTAPGGEATKPAESSPTAASGATEPAGASPTAAEAKPTEAPVGERGGGGNLRLLYWQAPVILNVHLANGTKDYHACRVCMEPLADWDIEEKPVLFLAAEFPSVENKTLAPDGTWCIWKLREGVKWHDGEDFDADDVVFTYEYVTNTENATTTIGRYQTIKTVEKVDNYTIKVTFKEPTPAWYDPFTTTEGCILPEHIFKDYQGSESRNAPANLKITGTGPFKVREFRPGDVCLYDLFEDYWDPGKPHLDSVEMKGGGDSAGAARAVLQTGEGDWAWNIQVEPSVLAPMEKAGFGKLDALPGGGTERLMINFSDPNTEVDGQKSHFGTPHPIWSDVRARQALAYLCDRGTIAEQLYGKGGVAATNQFDVPAKFTNKELTAEFNIDKAKALLDEMGFKGGDILYQTTINTVRQKTQEIIKQAMESVGFKVQLKSIDSAVYFSTDQGSPDTSGKFNADLEMHTNGSDLYPATWFERYRTDQIAQKENGWAGSNYFRYSNPEYDKMHDQCRVEMDPDKQITLFQAMMKLVTETDAVEVPLVNRTGLSAMSNKIEGRVGSPWAADPPWELRDWTLKG